MERTKPQEIKKDNTSYPLLLRETPGAPEQIFVLGNITLLSEPSIAIVGTRKATEEGRTNAKQIAREFSNRNVVVVSGLALGIDAAAHEGALAGTYKKTIAVLANGLHEIYPRQHFSLAEKILQNNGAIISEYPFGTPPLPHQFLERNRIVSGLSLATIVIEAPIHSGAIRTANNAIEQGREVYVLPGPAGHPHYSGSHMLIRNGARLISSWNDLEEDLASLFQKNENILSKKEEYYSPETMGNESLLRVLAELGHPATVDEIIDFCGKDPSDVLSELTMLTIAGTITEENGLFCIKRR